MALFKSKENQTKQEKFYYIVYKTTNLINGKIYIGSHKTDNLDDGYLGFGKYLRSALNKYGVENFIREILFQFETSKEMYDKEAELVNEEFIRRKDNYNIKLGGHGGFDHLRGKVTVKDKDGNTFQVDKNDPRYLSGELVPIWTGKKHKHSTKRKIGEENSKHQRGSGNSCYGMMWVFNDVLKENKKIKKVELLNYINNGWITGRKMKYHLDGNK